MSTEISTLVEELADAIGGRNLTFAIAESCTGGMLCSALVANPDVSGALERGLIVYSTDSKCELLGIDRVEVEACKGVSSHIASGMAKATLILSHADLAVAITGFAGPQLEEEEVGLVHMALARRDGAVQQRAHHFGDIGREAVCQHTVVAALELMIEAAKTMDA